jgi:hypothetical protein
MTRHRRTGTTSSYLSGLTLGSFIVHDDSADDDGSLEDSTLSHLDEEPEPERERYGDEVSSLSAFSDTID